MCDYLLHMKSRGEHFDTIRYASSSISMACTVASDGKIQQGKSRSVTSLLKGFRVTRPVRQKGTKGEYSDVVRLYEEAWNYGPTEALSLRHKKERAILLLAADTACRPVDLTKLFRVFEGNQRQIVFYDGGVRVRFFYPKEVDPGSSRQNTTNYYFSKWVDIHSTTPASVSTPEILKEFLEASSGSAFAHTRIPQFDSSAQPFVYARKDKNGKWLGASVDHIAKLIRDLMLNAGMKDMTARSLRGASPSKIYQLFPDMLQQSLDLGRWTTSKTFFDHYCCPVIIRSTGKPPASLCSNPQQVLRWGFKPNPPPRVSAKEYFLLPDHWVSKTIPGVGEVQSFEDGVYKVRHLGKCTELFHYKLMSRISEARQAKHSR